MAGNEENKEMSIREQIEWLLDRIDSKEKLEIILAMVAKTYSGGRW